MVRNIAREIAIHLSYELSFTDKTVEELNAKIKGYETDSAKTRIALEEGLSYEYQTSYCADDRFRH